MFGTRGGWVIITEDYGQWVRHYDNLQWNVTSILLAANGALLAFSADPEKFRPMFGVGGLLVTALTMLFAATMREARQRFQSRLPWEMRVLISVGRKWYLWRGFEALFVGLACSWTWLLIDHVEPPNYMWLIPGLLAVAATLIIGESVNRPAAFHPDDA